MRRRDRRLWASIITFAALFGISSVAVGQQIAPKPGTTFVYDAATWKGSRGSESDAARSESVTQILRVDGDVIWAVAASGTNALPIRLFRGLYSFEFEFDNVTFRNEIDYAKAAAFWPLEVGRSLTLTGRRVNKRGDEEFRSSGATYALRLTALRREAIQTPAGTFDAMVIERTLERFSGEAKLQDRDKSTTWYVPALGWYVRHDSYNESYRPDTGARTVSHASSVVLREIRVPR